MEAVWTIRPRGGWFAPSSLAAYAKGMRLALPCAVAFPFVSLACGAGLNQSNGMKLGEALAFAAAAGAAQVVEAAAEQRARNNAPVTQSSTGANVSPGCGNSGQYACLTVTSSSPAGGADEPSEPEMGDDEARNYVLGYVNGVRKLNGVGPLVRDDSLDAFAQAGSDELAADHRPNAHWVEHVRELRAASAEVQGSPDGARPGPLQEQIGESLLGFMGEGPGGTHHDTLLMPEWRKLGVGIVTHGGRTYLTVDCSS